jgi:hypothetical protein
MFLALLLAAIAAFVDSRLNQPDFAGWLVILCAFVLALRRPQRPWRWGVVIGSAIVVESLLRFLPIYRWISASPAIGHFYAKLGEPKPFPPSIVNAIISFVPAIAAAYLGSWIAQAWSRFWSMDEPQPEREEEDRTVAGVGR